MTKRIEAVDPWDRRPTETARHYTAFVTYMELGVTRSLRKIQPAVGYNLRTIAGLSRTNDWVDRAAAWDEHRERERLLENTEAIKQMAGRHANTALLMQQKALDALQALDTDRMTHAEVRQFLVDAIKIERAARGEPTERIDMTTAGEAITRRNIPSQPETIDAMRQMAEVLHRSHQIGDEEYAEILIATNTEDQP